MTFKFYSSDIDSAITKIKKYIKDSSAYIIEIKKAKSKRSLNQNRYYWGIIVTLVSQTTGYTREEAHQVLGYKFLRYEKDGQEFIKSTTELDTLDAEKFFEQCRLWAWHELNIHIPLPNEVTEEVYMQLQNIYSY